MSRAEMSSLEAVSAGNRGQRIAIRLKFYFAALTCLGGLVLSSGTENSSIPAVAVFFSIFGFLFVDWLELFALPPLAAYAAMAVAALFCVSDFLEMDAPGNHQMIAVAQLLVFVQAILMLQRKNRRIFEQLGVFCLLELIVAAVFNNAISYGLLLIPIAVIGAWALSLLAALSASEGLTEIDVLDGHRPESLSAKRQPLPVISVSAPETWESLSRWTLRLPRWALLTLAPSVMLVGLTFFYALPRTTDAARVKNRGNALVGFSDELRLEQIGQMMQSTEPALRLYLTDRSTGKPYSLVGGVYLRGKVLERYHARNALGNSMAIWNAIPATVVSEPQPLPLEYFPSQSSERGFYDEVEASVVCESMRSSALFGIAPYHQSRTSSEVIHYPELWTLGRKLEDDWVYPRIEYRFGTHAFRTGIQTELMTYRAAESLAVRGDRPGSRYRELMDISAQRRREAYLEDLLQFDIDAMPTAAELASTLAIDSAGHRRSDYEIAKAMERHFLTNRDYQYTLNLNAEPIPGMDPIEQFLRVDKRGHCQYFASALAMMLRSEGIPSRLVVGYHTDEYNQLGNHYVARQLHAHAWVEALVDRDQLTSNPMVYGQERSDVYWLRLDPTPPAGRLQQPNRPVGQMFDMARNMWDDYVVDMDADRQENALMGGGSNPMNRSYQQFVDRLSNLIRRIRAGELGGGSLASGDIFSWPGAVLGGLFALLMAMLLRFRPPAWIRRRLRRHPSQVVATPSIEFYAETLRQLERLGLVRGASQTPAELAVAVEDRFRDAEQHPLRGPLEVLTSEFYLRRFGEVPSPSGLENSDLEKPGSIGHAPHREADSGVSPVTGHLAVTGHFGPTGHAQAIGPFPESRESEVNLALADLTRVVDLMVRQGSHREHAT